MCTVGRAVGATGCQDLLLERAHYLSYKLTERVMGKIRYFTENQEGVGGLPAVRFRKEVGKKTEDGKEEPNE